MRRMRLPAQVALLVACLAGSILVAQLQDAPRPLHALTWQTDEGPWNPTAVSWSSSVTPPPNATYAWDGAPIVVGALQPIEYNETRDATLAGALVCSHKPCGPLVWIRGNVTGPRPFVLRPSADALTLEELDQPRQEPSPTPSGDGSSGPVFVSPTPSSPRGMSRWGTVGFAVAQPFEAEPAQPVALGAAALRVAPLLLLALVPGRAPRWQHALVLGAVVLGAWMAYGLHDDSWAALLPGLVIGLVAAASALGLVVVAVAKRRVSPFATAGLALGFAFFGAISVLAAYAPVVGGE